MSNPNCILKGISLFYTYLRDGGEFIKTHTINKWESDLCQSISESQWKVALQVVPATFHSVIHWEQYFRIIHRSYLTPAKPSLMYTDHSPDCWRRCGKKGMLLHTFWYCKLLHPLWNTICSNYYRNLRQRWAVNTENGTNFVGNMRIDIYPVNCRTIKTHLRLSTTARIAAHWKQIEIPPFSESISEINSHVGMEKQIALSNNTYSTFRRDSASWCIHPSASLKL